jgi:integral membrane protein
MSNEPMKSLETAMKLFRVMALWCGVMSLLLWFVNVPTHYWIGKSYHHYFVWVALVHGFTYPIYVLAAFNYSLKSNKSFTNTILFILAGTLPVASFIAERKVVKEFNGLKASN